MDFVLLPPEINSARMYTGAGSGSLLAAAGSWDSLSAELSTTAENYESVLSQLTSLEWRGAASEAMTATAASYMRWLQTAAEQTKQTATQVRAAAAAYEHAFAMTVPPAAVTANRTRLTALIASNIAGQNTAAIAATEAQYAEYWAQDSAAMSGYAASSAATTRLPRFASPNQTSNESGLAAQTASINQANADAVTSGSVSNALSLLNPQLTAAATSPSFIPLDLDILDVIQGTGQSLNSVYYMEAFASGVIGAESNLGVLPKVAAAPAALAPALSAAAPLGGGAGLGNVTVSLARAGTIGPMSVPATWVAPSAGSHVTAFEPLGMTTIPGTEEAAAAGYPGYPGMPGAAASRASGISAGPRYGVRLTVMPRPPAAG